MDCKYVAIDIGGTFTDLVAYSPDAKELMRAKALTTPRDPSDGFMETITTAGLSLDKTGFVKHGTTLAINTVTEGNGARTALMFAVLAVLTALSMVLFYIVEAIDRFLTRWQDRGVTVINATA